jgi:tetratricopeptide (TPR) repeat protein
MNRVSIYIISIIFLLSACATAPVEKTKKVLTPAEQETESLEVFNKILTISRSSDDRQAMLPEMEETYAQLIKDYPDTPLAQESHWRLIIIYVNDYSPPLYEKAEALYSVFLENYPQSVLRGLIDRTLGISYYKNAEWERLLKFSAPAFKKYTEEGKDPRPFLVLMYAEASFRLGNFEEAEKGYKIVIEHFPELNENKRAKARLQEIRKK